jgi:hypothetical protein
MAISKKKQQEKVPLAQEAVASNAPPLMAEIRAASTANTTRSRGNRSAFIERTNRFSNIEDGLIPFNYSKTASNTSNLDVRDAVALCQKAY